MEIFKAVFIVVNLCFWKVMDSIIRETLVKITIEDFIGTWADNRSSRKLVTHILALSFFLKSTVAT